MDSNEMPTILVVDNSKVVRQIIREELEKEGFVILEADHPDRVFEVLASKTVHLVTLAVELPGKNGYELSALINSESFINSAGNHSKKRIPIVFVTSQDTLEGRTRGFESGAADFLSKPFESGEIAQTVKNLLFPEYRLKGLTALVVDDSGMSRKIVADYLKSLGVIVLEASDGKSGFEIMRKYLRKVDMVITDLMMPGMKGNELCFKIRKELDLKNIPILVLSGKAAPVSILELFRAGATDYLMKPFIKEELLGRLTIHLEARLLTKKLVLKIKKMKEMNHLLKKIATTDSMTKLPNRRYFFDRLSEAVERKERYGHSTSMLIIDVDHFKNINDRFGHQVGDWILKELAQVVRATVRKVDIVGRLGGEEFGVLVSSTDEEGVTRLAEKILKAVDSRQFLKEKDLDVGHVTCSIGIYNSHKGDKLTPEMIYKLTDERLFKAKHRGRNRLCNTD